MRNAETQGRRAGVPARELLHMALERALRPKVSRPDIPIVPYLSMLMKSIGSGIRQAKARAIAHGRTVPFDHVAEQVPSTKSIVDPFQTLVRLDEQAFYERILGQVVEGDPKLSELVDGIGLGEHGRALQSRPDVSKEELATLRHRLKRKVSAIVAGHGLNGSLSRAAYSSGRGPRVIGISPSSAQKVTLQGVTC